MGDGGGRGLGSLRGDDGPGDRRMIASLTKTRMRPG